MSEKDKVSCMYCGWAMGEREGEPQCDKCGTNSKKPSFIINVKAGLDVKGSVATKLSGQSIHLGKTRPYIIDVDSPGDISLTITDPTQEAKMCEEADEIAKTYKIICFCSNCGADKIKLHIPKGTKADDIMNERACPKCKCSNSLLRDISHTTLGSVSK